MSSIDTTKHGEDNNNIDTIAQDIERVVISEDKKDTDKDCTSCEQNNNVDNVGTDVMFTELQTRTKRGKDDSSDSFECSLCSWGQTTKICKSCEQKLEQAKNDDDDDNEDFNSVTKQKNTSTCASCGKEGYSDDMNTCNKCKEVKYCNAACKKKHRTKHKKSCERRVAELHDEKLFKEHPPSEECHICFLPLQHGIQTESFMSCCGKVICAGCIVAMKMSVIAIRKSGGKINDLCAFCRTPPPSSDKESLNRIEKLVDKGNANAFYTLGLAYRKGDFGLTQSYQKANELYLKAGGLGCSKAYYGLGISYEKGTGVAIDKNKAKHYYELAAIGGYVGARHNLTRFEADAGNVERAMAHLVLAARAGDESLMNKVKEYFIKGIVTKDGYATTLRAYHDRQKVMKSDAREEAAALLLKLHG